MSNKISLTLPVDPAYVSAARLTASSVANRMGFDIDEIEDIKAAVSEAGTYIIKHCSSGNAEGIQISFEIEEDEMVISILVENAGQMHLDDEDMGLIMIKALVDDFKTENISEENNVLITMVKKHISVTFEP